jgi:hypothetical protein
MGSIAFAMDARDREKSLKKLMSQTISGSSYFCSKSKFYASLYKPLASSKSERMRCTVDEFEDMAKCFKAEQIPSIIFSSIHGGLLFRSMIY